uniref:Uncharacterized protein n=1 Tax=Glossina pallidipes TaxID=7398 RepID=A0A1A9ZN94_GLOPL
MTALPLLQHLTRRPYLHRYSENFVNNRFCDIKTTADLKSRQRTDRSHHLSSKKGSRTSNCGNRLEFAVLSFIHNVP